MDTSRGSFIKDGVAPVLMLDDQVTLSQVRKITESTMTQLATKLDTRMAQKTGTLLFTMIASHYSYINLAFVREKLKRATRKVLMSKMSDDGIIEVFEAVVTHMAISAAILEELFKALVTKEATIVPAAMFVASQARKEGERGCSAFFC